LVFIKLVFELFLHISVSIVYWEQLQLLHTVAAHISSTLHCPSHYPSRPSLKTQRVRGFQTVVLDRWRENTTFFWRERERVTANLPAERGADSKDTEIIHHFIHVN
jgi:hypothetical protein